MALTLLELKNYLKSSRGLTRGREDGLLPDSLLIEGIGNAIKRIAKDCDLLPTTKKVPLVAGQWKVPIPEEVRSIIAIWREDTNGSRLPLTSITQTNFDSGGDPSTNTSANPSQYAYPIYEGRRYEWYVKAPPNTDFTEVSRITNGSRRTIEDSGANFGRTLSGVRISPGDKVSNVTGDSYGYIEVLDVITNKGGGACAAGTDSDTVVVAGVDFDALNVKVDDIICYPSTGVVKSYAFVTDIVGNTLTYEDMRGTLSAFAQALGIKVGQAQKIRLTTDPPHRGLRDGSRNFFQVVAETATLIGTTFTPTRCAGVGDLTNASVGQEAIASGGSHGYIEVVGSGYVDVTAWHGGVPVDGEIVLIKACDEYNIETAPRIQPVMFIRPTPSVSDALGEEKLTVHFDIEPYIPSEDYEFIDIPGKWEDGLRACAEWQVARLTGTHKPKQLAEYKQAYLDETGETRSDIHETPRSEIQSPWLNRQRMRGSLGQAYEGVYSGHPYDISDLLAANDE